MCLRAVIALLRGRSLVCLLFQLEFNDGGWWISIESAVVVICEQFFTCLINERRVIVQEIIKKKKKDNRELVGFNINLTRGKQCISSHELENWEIKKIQELNKKVKKINFEREF